MQPTETLQLARYLNGPDLCVMRMWIILAGVFIVTAAYSIAVMIHMVLWRNEEVFYEYGRSWSRLLLRMCGIRATLVGRDQLDPAGRYIYVANHASLFDIPVILALVPDNVRIMYKRELERIPIFGWALKISPFIAIERERARDAADVLQKVVSTMASGSSVLVFPEGTRSEDGTVGVFRRGAFSLAVRSGRQIVPIALKGTGAILPKKSRRIYGGDVQLQIFPPVTVPTAPSRADELRLLTDVRQIIASAVDSQS
jgi:1-acyl-sn-glycerol-3-phosphate acyltransferase